MKVQPKKDELKRQSGSSNGDSRSSALLSGISKKNSFIKIEEGEPGSDNLRESLNAAKQSIPASSNVQQSRFNRLQEEEPLRHAQGQNSGIGQSNINDRNHLNNGLEESSMNGRNGLGGRSVGANRLENPKDSGSVSFYLGPCKTVNAFSCLDEGVKDQDCSFAEALYRERK
jgi:hypothetical protein